MVRWLVFIVLGLVSAVGSHAQTPPVSPAKDAVPLVFYTGDGQFEIIAMKARPAQEALMLATSVWRALAKPLGFPAEGFSSAVAVRLVPDSEWTGPSVFLVTAEPGGLVGVRVKWSDKVDRRIVRRALVQAVLLRQAVAWFGATPGLTVPLWLEQACTAFSEVRDRPAMFDAMQQESGQLTPPGLEGLLRWERGQPESREWELASFWLFQYLQTESGDDMRRWAGWLRAIMNGTDPIQALPAIYGSELKDPAMRELWWQVGYYSKCLTPALPLMSMDDTRNWLADRCRWLAAKNGREQVLSFDDLWTARKERWIREELTKRAEQLQSQLLRLHPFYRNAAISMGRMYQAIVKGDEAEFKSAAKDVAQDAADGREMEAATGEELDKIEAGH
jgi:hypothetical protein